jgi:hypothetical protein
MRGQFVKRTIGCLGIGENERALAEIVEQQRRQHQTKPRAADGGRTDMAHVGVKRFRTGQRKEHAAHHREGDERICQHEAGRLAWTQRFENLGRRPDIDDAEQGNNDEPADHDWAEQAADTRGPATLHHEQSDQDRERQRQDEVFECRRDKPEALHGRKDGNGRRDDAVAIEQRGSHNAKQDENRNPRAVRDSLRRDQRQQGQDSAFAVVVGKPRS